MTEARGTRSGRRIRALSSASKDPRCATVATRRTAFGPVKWYTAMATLQSKVLKVQHELSCGLWLVLLMCVAVYPCISFDTGVSFNSF